MSTIDQLASSLGKRDEGPNLALAKQIVENNDTKAVQELVDHLSDKTAIQNDCIKVLYEVGELQPSMLLDHVETFIALLNHKNNRLQWGAMTALHTITPLNPGLIYESLPKIMDAAESGSVITRDYAVNILITLCGFKEYEEGVFSLLNEQLLSAPTNQLPMYAERAIPIINEKNRELFVKTLEVRLDAIEKESKRKRVEKVIQKVSQNKK